MDGLNPDDKRVGAVMDQHRLSMRGACGFVSRDVWGPREKSMGNPWTPTNPSGTVILRLAKNSLMHEEVVGFIEANTTVKPTEHLTYSTGPRGSRHRRNAAAAFLNEEFHPNYTISAENLFVTPGLASAIDALAWAVCNEGDGILIPQPFYNGFGVDILNRSNARVVPVPYTGVEGYSSLEDLFCPNVPSTALEATFCNAKQNSINPRALLISHPHNPLGRCYPRQTIQAFATFCGIHNLHFISDEIYAQSVFNIAALPNAVPFVSTLTLDISRHMNPAMAHVLYGASKDFCANGLRLGLVCTQNEGVLGAMSSISIFSWSPHLIQDVWAAMLADKDWRTGFMHRKKQLMEEHYRLTTAFFQQNRIPYCVRYLRHLIRPTSKGLYSASPANKALILVDYKEREVKIAETCAKNGEFGWFRVTFTVGNEALKEGLERLQMSIREIEAMGAW
ncbi:pyridoxal phosphate-dependent aminotransferase [Aspergillus aculeatinus CBS 121060]|uniref:PLP-dependent transferase n=1 Tax=Aspergillus aculeatinus CBS 121060 TaxID=1448322 RepID=A0ACD1GVJ1_9EURO|nr:PLP-dependent transferase [Aspergillus aculeatinus CBS 121060]RAH65211.1 PLP-dependent transferase [Aspergillus aculeatinus CBS 121060]